MPIPNINNLQNGKVYKLTCGDYTYYGSTVSSLNQRFYEHTARYRKYGAINKRYNATQLWQYGTPKIELVEAVPCNSYKDLLARERHYIENNPCINKRVPGRTHAEYYAANRDKRLQQMRDNYRANKELRQSLQKITVN
jgi:predicted GIY-YIG superfamily endonuclease